MDSYKDIFNINMSSSEARTVLFTIVEGKNQEEIEQIKSQYSKVLPMILEREHKLAENGWCID